MGKKENIKEMINILAIALRHKIGGIVNKDQIYSSRYAKDAQILIREAEKISLSLNLNDYDKSTIRIGLKKKLKIELEKKDFLDYKKFDYMDDEIEIVLKDLGLS